MADKNTVDSLGEQPVYLQHICDVERLKEALPEYWEWMSGLVRT